MQTFGELIMSLDVVSRNNRWCDSYDKLIEPCPCSNKQNGFSRRCYECEILYCKHCIYIDEPFLRTIWNFNYRCMPCIAKEYAVGGEKYNEAKKLIDFNVQNGN